MIYVFVSEELVHVTPNAPHLYAKVNNNHEKKKTTKESQPEQDESQGWNLHLLWKQILSCRSVSSF